MDLKNSHQWVSSHYSGTREGLSCPGGGGGQIAGVHESLGGQVLLKCSSGVGLRFCISDKFPGNTDSVMPGCTLSSKDKKHGMTICDGSGELEAHLSLPLVLAGPAPPSQALSFQHLEGETTWIF